MDCFIKPRSIKLSQSYHVQQYSDHVISLLTMRLHFYISIRLLGLLLKTIFHFWQMHYLRLPGHKNIWGWRCLLEHCHEWIWFNFKHWKTNLKAILDAPTNSFWFFLWQFFPFVNPQGRKAPRWSTIRWVNTAAESLPQHHQLMEPCPVRVSVAISLRVWGRKVDSKRERPSLS